jgi:hypothetical protein
MILKFLTFGCLKIPITTQNKEPITSRYRPMPWLVRTDMILKFMLLIKCPTLQPALRRPDTEGDGESAYRGSLTHGQV